jgi:hypothetical protein
MIRLSHLFTKLIGEGNVISRKALGLSLAATLAAGSVAASTASAKEFKAEKYGAIVSVHNTAVQVFKFGTATTAECKKVTFESNEPKEIFGPSTTLRLRVNSGTEEYQECKAFGIAGATVKMNECNYVLHAPSAPTSNVGTVDIVCPVGKAITIEAGGCTVSIERQQLGLSKMTYLNSSPLKTVELIPALEKFKYEVSPSLLCPPINEPTLYSGANLAEGFHSTEVDKISVE